MQVDVEKELELVMVSLANQDQLKPVYTAKQVRELDRKFSFAQGFRTYLHMILRFGLCCDHQPFAQIPYFEDGDFALFGNLAEPYLELQCILC